MGILISTVPEIDNLYFKEMPSSRPVNVVKAVRVGRIYIFKDSNGNLYSNKIGRFAYMPGDWPWVDDTMKALLKLKVITKEQMDAHLEHCKMNSERREKEYALQNITEIGKKYGFKLTKRQISKLST